MAATVSLLRALVGDDGSTEIKNDAHYEAIITLEPNEYRAAATAAVSLAAHFAQKVSTSVDKVKIENQQKSEAYYRLAESYSSRAASGGGTTVDATSVGTPVVTGVSNSEMDSVRSDTDIYESKFVRDQFDNPNCCSACNSCPCCCGGSC